MAFLCILNDLVRQNVLSLLFKINMIFSFFNKQQILIKRQKQLFKCSPLFWPAFIILDGSILYTYSVKIANKDAQNIYIILNNNSRHNSIKYNKIIIINTFKNNFFNYLKFINLYKYWTYVKLNNNIKNYFMLFSKTNYISLRITPSRYSLNNYRWLKSNIFQNKEFIQYSSGIGLQRSSLFVMHQNIPNKFFYYHSQKIYNKKLKKKLKKKNKFKSKLIFKQKYKFNKPFVAIKKQINKWFNIQISKLIHTFKSKQVKVLFPVKVVYQFKKLKFKKKRYSIKTKKTFIKKLKKKKKKPFLSYLKLKPFNKYFLFNYLQNLIFNSIKKQLARKLILKSKFSSIKKIKIKLKLKKQLVIRKKFVYKAKKFTVKNKFIQNQIKTYRLKYKLNNLKNYFSNICKIIKKQGKENISLCNKDIDLFLKKTNHKLLFSYLISIATSSKLKKWEKLLRLSFIKKAQNAFFYALFYKNFKHNTIKKIYINKWKYNSFHQWLWLSKNIKKRKYKKLIIKKNKYKFLYYNLFIFSFLKLDKYKKVYYIKKNYINNLIKLYKKETKNKIKTIAKSRIFTFYSKKIKSKKFAFIKSKKKSIIISKFKKLTKVKKIIYYLQKKANKRKSKKKQNKKKIKKISTKFLLFNKKKKIGFYFKSVVYPHKPLHAINFVKIKNILSLLLNNRCALYYINVRSLTRLAFDDRAKKYSVKYRAFVLKYSIRPRSFILNEIVKVKTSNIYLKKLRRSVERRYIYVAIFIKDRVRITFFCIFIKKTPFLVNFYAYAFSKLTRKYKETVFIRFLIKILKSATINRKEIIGVRFRFKGRINRWRRTKYIVGQKGIWNYNSIKTIVDYSQSSAVTKKGIQGLSIWLCYKSNFALNLRITFINYINLSIKQLNT